MIISIDFLRKIVPNTSVELLTQFVDSFNKYAPAYGITTPERISQFVGNLVVESRLKPIKELGNDERKIRLYWENLNKRKEFNHTTPQDAVDYSGAGYLQLTGKKNYAAISQKIFGDNRLVQNPNLVLTPDVAMQTSLEWWKLNNMNAISDKLGIVGVSAKINTGSERKSKITKHLPERITAYKSILLELKKKVQSNNPFGSVKSRSWFSRFFSAIKK